MLFFHAFLELLHTVLSPSKLSDLSAMILDDVSDNVKMQDLIRECLTRQQLELFPELPLGDAVQNFVDKDDKDAIKK
jgi:hypothetical protein